MQGKAYKAIERKGFNVISEYMICMPTNFITPTPNEISIKMIRILPKKCALIAEEVTKGVVNRKKVLFIDRILLVFFAAEKIGAKIFGKTLKADEKCNGCEMCVKKCPRINIKMVNGKPKFGWQCVLCLRCVYSCPQNAIKVHMPILKKAVLKEGFNLKTIQKQAENTQMQDNEKTTLGGLWKGVIDYLNNKHV